MPTTTRNQLAQSAALLATTAILTTGCASIPQHTNQRASQPTSAPNAWAAIDLSELWAGWAPETSPAIEAAAPGPSLVAGDWLAWQCAYAGDYFNMDPNAIAAIQID